MKLQQATRYALWAVVELASRANEQVRAQELAERYDLSQNHMVRVLHALTKAKIVKSARGPGGGFTFCANANRLTVYDIICLFETGWPNEEGTEHEQHNPVVGELGRVLHEVDRITWATLRSATIQTIIKNATRAAASRPKATLPARRSGAPQMPFVPSVHSEKIVTFQLPAPLRRYDVALEDGAAIRARTYGNPNGARILMSHGNGFAVDAYYPYWRQFLPDFELVIFDFRNHGQNTPANPPHHTYAQLTHDLERVFQATQTELGAKPTIGIFHSMSARTAMKHAIEIGWRWSGLILFDPPDVPPPGHPNYAAMEVFENKLTEFARNRRRVFASIDELTQEYLASRATRNWVEGEHELMARSVLRKNPSGDGFVLVCDPENEAGIYAAAVTLNLWPKASEFGGPVKLIGADPNAKGAPATAPANRALAIEGGYDYDIVEGTGHLLQIERPDECFRLSVEFMKKHNLL